jgi:hypothetical protein
MWPILLGYQDGIYHGFYPNGPDAFSIVKAEGKLPSTGPDLMTHADVIVISLNYFSNAIFSAPLAKSCTC